MPPLASCAAMDLGLAGKVALVTGGSKGIGFGIAAGLAAEGARVAVASRDEARVRDAAERIGGHGVVFDSDDLDAVPGVIASVEKALGPIDVYIANTGGPPAGADPLGFTREQWESAHRTLVLSPMLFLERLLPGMRARGWGRVVAVGSMSVREPIAALQLSNAHRPGLVAAFKILARRFAADGVTLNTVLPGRIGTDRIYDSAGSPEAAEAAARKDVPAGRLGTVEEIAAAAVFLSSAPASYITGTTLLVDGGITLSV
jgi:3-oxoacyl-[acyl-carrier protein] reductase